MAALFARSSRLFVTVIPNRCVHLSHSRKAVWFMAPIARIAVAIGGRLARTAWRKLPEEERKTIRGAIKRRKRLLWGIGLLGVFGGYYYYYSCLELVPLTNRQRFMMYSRQDVHRLLTLECGEEYISQFVDPASVLPREDPHCQLAAGIMRNILHSNSWCKDLTDVKQWRLIVAQNDDIVNAVSLPTGDIVLFTGLMKQCRNHDELGFIIGHEVAHVVLNHGSESLSHTGLLSFLGLFVIGAIWFIVPSDLLSFFLHKLFTSSTTLMLENPYSQKIEHEADKVGLMFASKACYHPENSIRVWKHMPELGKESEYLSTHPCNEERLANLTTLLPIASQLYTDSNCSKEFFSFKKIFKKILK